MNNFTTAAKLGERSRCFARHFCSGDRALFQGKESDQAETQSAAFYVGGFVFVFHDKYQSYKYDKIQQGNLLG